MTDPEGRTTDDQEFVVCLPVPRGTPGSVVFEYQLAVEDAAADLHKRLSQSAGTAWHYASSPQVQADGFDDPPLAPTAAERPTVAFQPYPARWLDEFPDEATGGDVPDWAVTVRADGKELTFPHYGDECDPHEALADAVETVLRAEEYGDDWGQFASDYGLERTEDAYGVWRQHQWYRDNVRGVLGGRVDALPDDPDELAAAVRCEFDLYGYGLVGPGADEPQGP